MAQSQSNRKKSENESVFRQYNERVQQGIEELNRTIEETRGGLEPIAADTLLDFYCECSDESCQQRIGLKLGDYTRLHGVRSDFTVVPGHEVGEVERVIEKQSHYYVVRKNITPPETVRELSPTDMNNV